MSQTYPEAVRDELKANPALADAFDAEVRGEIARKVHHDRYARRQEGVCWSGMEALPFEPRTVEQLYQRAKAAVARNQAFAESYDGKGFNTLLDVERLEAELQGALIQLRAARSRAGTLGDAGVIRAFASVDELTQDISIKVATIGACARLALAEKMQVAA